ncbi:DNA repair protein RecO [Litoribacillus peritrichatus]|uniref:DNA repair protein RecO n=1 Tax=Litoribacillus peritrichatus TaxID=718191 RepID=A0ABP7N8W4_9GAMM
MSEHVEFQPSFLLHQRCVGEKDALCTFFTREYGRLNVWVKGKYSEQGQIPLFKPLLISWRASETSLQLTHIEINRQHPLICHSSIVSDFLYSAFYVNELNYKLLPEFAASEELYSHYVWLLESMAQKLYIEPILRAYELQLLVETGNISDIFSDVLTGAPLNSGHFYRCINHSELGFGLTQVDQRFTEKNRTQCFLGEHLLKFEANCLDTEVSLSDIKRLMRILIHSTLKGETLKSRTLFTSFKKKGC